MTSTLGFFTQNELDRVVGYRRRRQRLVESGLLPGGRHVKTFGQDAIIFPELAAAALVVEKPTDQDAELLGYLRATTERLLATESFAVLSVAMRDVLRAHRSLCLENLASAVVEHSADALQAWRAQLAEAESELAQAGILMTIQVGRIEDVSSLGYGVRLFDTGESIRVAANAIRSQLAAGTWVTRNIIQLGARKGEVLVPTIDGDMLRGMRENTAVVDTEAALLDEMFANTDFKPVAVPYVLETDDASPSTRDEVPTRRFNIRTDRAQFVKANTMARSRRHGPVPTR